MKRIICIILAAILFACLAGCQKSPESPIVVGKNVDLLIDKATEADSDEDTQTPAPEASDYSALLAEKLGVPERFITDASYSDERLKISADAEIILPNAAALPVMRVEPENFSQELADKLYDVLIGDTLMYQQQMRYTKKQIEEDLVRWRRILEEPGSVENGDQSKEQAKEKIAELEAAYDSAPDNPELIPADAAICTQQEIDFTSGKTMCEYSGVDIAENPGIGLQQGKSFSIRNNTKDGEIIIEENVGGWTVTDTASQGAKFYYSDNSVMREDACYITAETVTPDSLTDRPEQVGGFSYEDAMNMAYEFLDEAGIEDMKVKSLTLTLMLPEEYNAKFFGMDVGPAEEETLMADIKSGEYDDEVLDVMIDMEFGRTVNGIPVTSNGSSCYIGDAMFGEQWIYESFSVKVSKEGIYTVAWRSPNRIIETVTENANLRSFDEIADIFDNMFRVTYDNVMEGSNLSGKVDRVTLTLRRIMEQNNIGYGLYVPVWDFYGTMELSEPDYPENGTHNFLENEPILTINAIDGSVIDLDMGY